MGGGNTCGDVTDGCVDCGLIRTVMLVQETNIEGYGVRRWRVCWRCAKAFKQRKLEEQRKADGK